MTTPSAGNPLIFQINPLPDFLGDHTLPGQNETERLQQYASRWVQFVASLWSWRDRASFAIRYVSSHGATRIFLAAVPVNPEDAGILRDEIMALLYTHRLLRHSDAEVIVSTTDFAEISRLHSPAFVEFAQHTVYGLWKPQPIILQDSGVAKPKDREPLREGDLLNPPAIYPWRGPGGPFLLPMESLLCHSVKITLTIYLAPTELRPHEWKWLALMSTAAQSAGDNSFKPLGMGAADRRVDPSAALAGKLYMASFRHLSARPYMVLVQCAADAGRHDVARSVAGTIESILQENPLDKSDSDLSSLPTGASPYDGVDKPANEIRAAKLYESLVLHSAILHQPLGRLPLLTDAAGAATMFRFPVSIRGGVPGISVRQFPPDFHPGAREDAPPAEVPSIRIGKFEGGGAAFVPVADLTRHTLITGFTGTGKTVTVLGLLHQLWVTHGVPFLVLESAKQEYRGLCKVPGFLNAPLHLRIYTLGNENCVPFRLNPFQLLPGVRVEAHIGRLQVCFEAASPPIGPSVSVITEALYRVYEQAGWRLNDVYPLGGKTARRFPTLKEYVEITQRVINERGYSGETLDNVRAALIGRLKPLLLGSKGKMYDVQFSEPSPDELFAGPAILELNDLNLDEKAMAVMFLLTLLREYREINRGDGQRLLHVTVVEEAHNILAEVKSEGSGEGATKADTRFKAVEAFCAMLSEIRSLGEGLIISDQSPGKLARDAMRNTNFQIAHQLRDATDRNAIGDSMIMDKEQRDYLGKLGRGYAAIFRTGFEKAAFVKIDSYYSGAGDEGWGFRPNLEDTAIIDYMRSVNLLPTEAGQPLMCNQGCELCAAPCPLHDVMFALTNTSDAQARASEWFKLTTQEGRAGAGKSFDDVWHEAVADALHCLTTGNIEQSHDAIWCHFVHRWHLAARVARYEPQDIALTRDHRNLLLQVFQWMTANG